MKNKKCRDILIALYTLLWLLGCSLVIGLKILDTVDADNSRSTQQLAIDWIKSVGYNPLGATCLDKQKPIVECSVSTLDLVDPITIYCKERSGECSLREELIQK